MKYFLFVILLFCGIAVKAQCAYPDAKSTAQKPMWLTKELPPKGSYYYYDTGYGVGETYEKAFDKAIVNIGKKRKLATGQNISFDSLQNTAISEPLTVKARIEQDYWECCTDAVMHKKLYYVKILCVVANNPSNSISKVKTDKKYLRP